MSAEAVRDRDIFTSIVNQACRGRQPVLQQLPSQSISAAFVDTAALHKGQHARRRTAPARGLTTAQHEMTTEAFNNISFRAPGTPRIMPSDIAEAAQVASMHRRDDDDSTHRSVVGGGFYIQHELMRPFSINRRFERWQLEAPLP